MPQLLPQRQCLYCTALLNGRSDKKFCSSSCKAHYHRASSIFITMPPLPPLSASEAELAQALLAYSPWDILSYYFRDDKCPAYTKRFDRVSAAQKHQDPFYTEYANIIIQFLCCQFDDIRDTGYEESVEQLTEAIDAYLQHPGLLIPGHIAHHRLADLNLLNSLFEALHKQVQLLEAKGPYPRGKAPEMPASYDYLSKRQQQQLWANLLGVP